MKYIKGIIRFFRILLFAFIFSICMILGVVPIIPKGKEQVEIEIKIEDTEEKDNVSGETSVEQMTG